jgi:hypothetical protein
MQALIRHQVEAFERTARDLHGRFAPHSGVAADWKSHRAEIEGMMDLLVATFDSLGRTVHRFQDEAPTLLTDPLTRDYHDLFVRLSAVFAEVMTYGRAAEAAGCEIEGKARFVQAWRELKGIAAMDPALAGQSSAQLRNGGGKPLGELADELSRDLVD